MRSAETMHDAMLSYRNARVQETYKSQLASLANDLEEDAKLRFPLRTAATHVSIRSVAECSERNHQHELVGYLTDLGYSVSLGREDQRLQSFQLFVKW